jgi:dihydrofolate reductase
LKKTLRAARSSLAAVCRYYPMEKKVRKVVASLFMTLDGVVEAPEAWHFRYADDEMEAVLAARMADEDAILLGRRTYEEFARTWPQSTSPFAGHMNETRKIVVSETLAGVDWQNSTLIDEPIAQQLPKLKHTEGANIAVTGSVTLVQSLLLQGLIDELRLLVHPVIVGRGRRLVTSAVAKAAFDLVSTDMLSSGVLDLVYVPRPCDLGDAETALSRPVHLSSESCSAPGPMHTTAEAGHRDYASVGC